MLAGLLTKRQNRSHRNGHPAHERPGQGPVEDPSEGEQPEQPETA